MYKKALVTGCFDIFHYGHLLFLQKAKSLCEYLVVGLAEDNTVRRVKGDSRPIFGFSQRSDMLNMSGYVDKIYPFSLESQFNLTVNVMPHVIFEGIDGNSRMREIVDEFCMDIPILKINTEFIHTTDILMKIDAYSNT